MRLPDTVRRVRGDSLEMPELAVYKPVTYTHSSSIVNMFSSTPTEADKSLVHFTFDLPDHDLPPSPPDLNFTATSDYFSLDSISLDSFSLELSLPPPTAPAPPPSTDILSVIGENSTVIAAKELLSDGRYDEALSLLYSADLPARLHATAQETWLECVYKRAAAHRTNCKKKLNAVDRYRLRKRFPFPPGIFNGDTTRHLFRESSREILHAAYTTCAYPTPAEKRELCQQSGLTYNQVSNYFKNRRGRDRAAGVTVRTRAPEPPKPFVEDPRALLAMLQQ